MVLVHYLHRWLLLLMELLPRVSSTRIATTSTSTTTTTTASLRCSELLWGWNTMLCNIGVLWRG